jgi:hypothetical protein
MVKKEFTLYTIGEIVDLIEEDDHAINVSWSSLMGSHIRIDKKSSKLMIRTLYSSEHSLEVYKHKTHEPEWILMKADEA